MDRRMACAVLALAVAAGACRNRGDAVEDEAAKAAKGGPAVAPATAMPLAKDGKTDYVIVEADAPLPSERLAARELAGYLKRVKAIGFEPKPGVAIVANFGRSRHLKSDAAASQLSTWSPLLYRGFHGEVDKFGAIILASGHDEPFASFEGPTDLPTLAPNNGCLAKVSQDKDRASDGQSSLRVEFPPTKTSVDVGVSIGCGELNDWSGASALVADVYYEGNWDKWQWLFTTRLDGESKPLDYHGVRLAPGWNKGIVLADLVKAAEKADMRNVKRVYLYVQTGPERTEPLVIHMDNIRLVRKPGGEK